MNGCVGPLSTRIFPFSVPLAFDSSDNFSADWLEVVAAVGDFNVAGR